VFSQHSTLLLASVRFAASPRYLVSITLHSITATKIRIRQVPTASLRNARKKHGILPATKIAYSVNANATPTFWLRNNDNTEQTFIFRNTPGAAAKWTALVPAVALAPFSLHQQYQYGGGWDRTGSIQCNVLCLEQQWTVKKNATFIVVLKNGR
jgi:hypothetical protein